MPHSSAPDASSFVELKEFTLFPELVIELRTMIVVELLPEPAILAFRHETLFYKSHKQQNRTVRWIPDLTYSFNLDDLRNTRVLGLLRVNKEFRAIYLNKFPISIKVCQARRERKESKLYFSDKDLIFLQTFFGKISLERTFESIGNTPTPFGQLTRLALTHEALVALLNPDNLKQFFAAFPTLMEIKILSKNIRGERCFSDYGYGGYHGLHPDPGETNLNIDETLASKVKELVDVMKDDPSVVANQVSVPKITFL